MRIAFSLVAAVVFFFALAGAAFSQVVFTDDFDDGRKPDWKVVSGNWGDVGGMLQATAVTDGNYFRTEEYWKVRDASPHGILLGRTFPTFTITLTKVPVTVVFGDEPKDRSIIVVSTLAPTDCTIDMDSTPFIPPPDGPIPQWPNPGGITGSFSKAVMRYTDPQNYILAGYHPGAGGALFIFEVINHNMHPRAFKPKPHFYTAGPLHLTATASGPIVTMTLTDSNGKTDSISGEMTTILGPGNVGLFHDDGASGFPPTSKYDNFVVSTVPGKGKKTNNRFSDFFAKGVFYINENDSMVNRTYIDDPTAAQAYYDRTMKDLAGGGFNLVTVYWTPVDHRKMVLDSAQKYGLKVIVHLPEIASMIKLGDQVNLFDFSEYTTRALRDHPAVAGYYIVDEPLVKPEVIARAELARLALEVSDPNHPSFLGLADVAGKYEDVLRTVNVPVLLVDSYPVVSNWSGDFSGYVEQLERGQRNAGDRPLWIIPQVFGKPEVWKTPTPEEIRAEVWLALAYGAKGFIHFIYQSTTSNGEEWIRGLVDMDLNPIDGRLDELKQLNADLDRLAPTRLSLHPTEFTPPQVSDSVVARAFQDAKGTRYVILANTDVKNPATFAWTGVATTDVLTGKKIRSQISLVPGGGKVVKLQ
jgi:hypothetical protein